MFCTPKIPQRPVLLYQASHDTPHTTVSNRRHPSWQVTYLWTLNGTRVSGTYDTPTSLVPH